MQIYIKRSKNRTASGVFLHSLILRPHQPSRARKRQKDALFCKKLLKSARKRQKGALLGRKARKSAGNQGTDVYDSRLKLNPIAEAGHYRDQGHLLPFPRAVIVDDGERIVAVQHVVYPKVEVLQVSSF